MKKNLSKLYFLIVGISIIFLIANCSSRDLEISNINNSFNEEYLLKISKGNSTQIKLAIENCPVNQKEGLLFLLQNMPERDLQNLSSEFLLTNLEFSYKVMEQVKWGKEIPKNIFLNYILPYANLHERRDNWREDFHNKFYPLIKDLNSPSEATLKLNKEIWNIVNVHYSTKRPKADQSPYESIDAGLASCTGLSIILIDACRSVGIPARFVGVPLWKDQSGNHSWVEIWDNGWHFIGAEEESPLNKTWFGERALTSDDSEWKYSIYAASFKKTDVIFPPLFDSTATYVYADIVTNRYSKSVAEDGKVILAIRLFDKPNGKRIKGNIKILLEDKIVEEGITKDEKHDFNDFLIIKLLPNTKYKIIAETNYERVEKQIILNESKYQFANITLDEKK
ncbi:MAG: transglutaminase domain-containing protein [Ignavibacteriae bacterium]|nr:transglutaminase domain-containing protein [Ignavibacteriota bacterium]